MTKIQTYLKLICIDFISSITETEIEIDFRDVQNSILAVSRFVVDIFSHGRMPILAVSRLHLIDPSSIEHNSACYKNNIKSQKDVPIQQGMKYLYDSIVQQFRTIRQPHQFHCRQFEHSPSAAESLSASVNSHHTLNDMDYLNVQLVNF